MPQGQTLRREEIEPFIHLIINNLLRYWIIYNIVDAHQVSEYLLSS